MRPTKPGSMLGFRPVWSDSPNLVRYGGPDLESQTAQTPAAPPRRKAADREKKPVARRDTAAPHSQTFPIVGIGTSAGGLAALEQFFRQMPAASGMAFVVIQHLDPHHKGMLPELLQRSTALPVMPAEHHMPVQPDHIYVIPSNRDIGIKDGSLLLTRPAKIRGLHLPIDSFFSALAANSGPLAVGVILSGMGSDGTHGSREIKSHGGLVAVQEPKSADFDSMPRSVIAAKCADLVATPAELPGKLLALYHKSAAAGPDTLPELDVKLQGEMGALIGLLRMRTGHDFSLYKKATLQRRIERRMAMHQLQSIGDYVDFLRKNPPEVDLLFKEMLIGVTNFFRDPAAWIHLRDKLIPALLKQRPQGDTLRAWTAGCSTGEEAYSLAIAFREAMAKSKLPGRHTLQIFATDLDSDAIDTARAGFYATGIDQDVGAERLFRYFTREEGGYRVNPEIREMVTFALQDVIHDPPFTKLDILSCRNLFIYFDADLQKKILALFHYSLKPDGVLFLGHSETVGHSGKLFTPLKNKLPLYQRVTGHRTRPVEFPTAQLRMLNAPAAAEPARPTLKLQSLAEQMLLQRFCPTAVLVNADGDILYISGRSGDYLEPAAGKANWNIYAMLREELRNDVTGLLNRALRQKGEFNLKNLRTGRGKQARRLSVSAQALRQPEELRGMALVTFIPADLPLAEKRGPRHAATPRAAELEEALRRAHEENRAIRESVNTTQEELKSANEELQSTNEELQSTNEELTTSKEEMQSMNEELQTVNAELQARVDELTRASSDMKNLLDSTEIITLFLDNDFHVRLFTQHATQIFKLIPGDIGRPLSDIVTDLSYPALQEDAARVLRTLVFSDKQVETGDGRWFRVRIMPYRTLSNVIDGVVITCTNITEAKRLEMQLRSEAR